MTQIRINAAICTFAAFAVGVLAADVASAESGLPEILLLAGKITELKRSTSGSSSVLESVGGKSIRFSKHQCTESSYTNDPPATLDANLGVAVCDYEGAKQGAVACRSENAKGTKDPVETILVVYDTHLAAETTSIGVLEPLLILTVLGIEHETELTLNCGGVKDKLKGKEACLMLPGLTNIPAGATIQELCKAEKGKQETGTCTVVKEYCEQLAKEPLEVNFGAGFEGAALTVHLEGSFNVDIFIDD